jgi:putative transposase
MVYGLKRLQQAEFLHFITFSCFRRFPFVEDARPKRVVEAVLVQLRARHQGRIYAYDLMPEHIHLLINEPPSMLLAQFPKAPKQTTSWRLKGDCAQFWQRRISTGASTEKGPARR